MSDEWLKICHKDEVIENRGVCALLDDRQIALFKVEDQFFAIGNFDPIGKAEVLSRGITGDLQGEWVVASPLYKQHFSLRTGRCLEEDCAVPSYDTRVEGDFVWVKRTANQ